MKRPDDGVVVENGNKLCWTEAACEQGWDAFVGIFTQEYATYPTQVKVWEVGFERVYSRVYISRLPSGPMSAKCHTMAVRTLSSQVLSTKS